MKKTYDVNGNITIESALASTFALEAIIVIMLIIFLTFSFIRIDKQLLNANIKLDNISERYEDLVYENETLWKYIENIDTFKTLDDAIEYRDDLIEQLQFIDE